MSRPTTRLHPAPADRTYGSDRVDHSAKLFVGAMIGETPSPRKGVVYRSGSGTEFMRTLADVEQSEVPPGAPMSTGQILRTATAALRGFLICDSGVTSSAKLNSEFLGSCVMDARQKWIAGNEMRHNVTTMSQTVGVITASETSIENRLERLARLHGNRELALRIGTNTRSVERWIRGDTRAPAYLDAALTQIFGTPSHVPTKPDSKTPTFVDLFAGIGGIRLGMESAGAECIFTSEWDKFAVKTYSDNHRSDHEILGDINSISPADVPDHDILTAGFPCQPFSLAGVSKKNSLGRSHGFLDETQGTLFFNVASIIAEKRPRAVLLENVKNLISHDKGKTFEVIKRTMTEELGYTLHYKVIDAKRYVPQHRERVIMAAFREGENFDWDALIPDSAQRTMDSVLHREDGSEVGDEFIDSESGKVLSKYTLSDGLWSYLQAYAAKHRAAGNGFGFGLVNRDSVSRTLSARYYKDGSEILVSQGPDSNPRRLTPRECARLMGFADDFRISVSDTQAYKQFGNSVAVPVIAAAAKELVKQLSTK